jgi:DnaA family protein
MQGLQLPLGVHLSDTASFESYYAGPNDVAVAALAGLLAPTAPPLLWLFGPGGCGKTHLLQALSRRAAGSMVCAYIPLREMSVEALEGLEQADAVCLDDIDAVLGDAQWPLVLLRFLDQLRAHGGRCALSASAPPERLALALPDLRTRFSAAAIYGIKPLTDDDRGQLLRERAQARGLDLPEEAARYLLIHLPRGTGELLQALDALDRASLSAQRRLTLPFVQQWLRDSARP